MGSYNLGKTKPFFKNHFVCHAFYLEQRWKCCTGDKYLTEISEWRHSMHKKSKAEHKKKSQKQGTRGTAKNMASLPNANLWQNRKYFRRGRWPHLILPLSLTLNINVKCTPVQMHLRGNQKSPKALKGGSVVKFKPLTICKHINSFSTQDWDWVPQEVVAATGIQVSQPVTAFRGDRAHTQPCLLHRHQVDGKDAKNQKELQKWSDW